MPSTYTELRKGAQGNNVMAMQNALRNAGYNVQNTGSFDDLTESALKSYQQANKLNVDGIAGDQTLSHLYGTTGKTDATTYTPSASVVEAKKYLQAMQNNRPGEYVSRNTDRLREMLDTITGRAPFEYDAMNDPMYNIYRDIYIQNGRRAMEDTMGQAAALTGGYGNSYAQSVGQQQYNQYMEDLNARVPELRQQAFEQYQAEGENLQRNYDLLNAEENRDYNRYRDTLGDWETMLQMAQSAYDNDYARDYGAFSDKRSYDLQVDQFNQQMALQQAQLALQQAQFDWQKEQAIKKSSGGGSGKGSGGSGGSAAAATTPTQTAEEIQANARDFIAGLFTANEWQRRKDSPNQSGRDDVKQSSSYGDYIENKTQEAYSRGQLSDLEAKAILDRYAQYIR